MELARLAVKSGAVVVVDAVGNVGGLLDFGKIAAAADGMDAAAGRWNISGPLYGRRTSVPSSSSKRIILQVISAERKWDKTLRLRLYTIPVLPLQPCLSAAKASSG